MYNTLKRTLISLLLLICYSYGQSSTHYPIQFYEYGERVKGDQIYFIYNGVIPEFKPKYTLSVAPAKEELERNFTYLRVEYYNQMSAVNISYDPLTSTLNFYINFPFVNTPIGVLGYSLPKNIY